MIKTHELRVGNWVRFIDNNEEFQIGCISHNEIEMGFVLLSEVEPIPLTEEWLMKFGFAKNKNTFILNKDSSVTHEKTGSESGFWYSNDESDAHCYRLKKIEFVHQLQNIFFSLCGEELNVKQL